jgi:hypothetical protein
MQRRLDTGQRSPDTVAGPEVFLAGYRCRIDAQTGTGYTCFRYRRLLGG